MAKKAKVTFEFSRHDAEIVANMIEDYLNQSQKDYVTHKALEWIERALRNATHIVIHDKLPKE